MSAPLATTDLRRMREHRALREERDCERIASAIAARLPTETEEDWERVYAAFDEALGTVRQ